MLSLKVRNPLCMRQLSIVPAAESASSRFDGCIRIHARKSDNAPLPSTATTTLHMSLPRYHGPLPTLLYSRTLHLRRGPCNASFEVLHSTTRRPRFMSSQSPSAAATLLCSIWSACYLTRTSLLALPQAPTTPRRSRVAILVTRRHHNLITSQPAASTIVRPYCSFPLSIVPSIALVLVAPPPSRVRSPCATSAATPDGASSSFTLFRTAAPILDPLSEAVEGLRHCTRRALHAISTRSAQCVVSSACPFTHRLEVHFARFTDSTYPLRSARHRTHADL